ncbi:uncharacterized protein [Rutidosis leptorrhynchoides]|uniref:uncharacterized protein n=1 Tax=Rutidosis leptorrhynchoides TaxID=125765 RepID=UPI003A995449
MGINFSNSFSKVIGNGSSISFWGNTWLFNGVLRDKFSRLYHLESNVSTTVSERLRMGSSACELTANWIRVTGGRSSDELAELEGLGIRSGETLRNNLVPKKVEVFVWRVKRRRIPTLFELDKRGTDLHSVLCPICGNNIETVEHALVHCPFVQEVWSKVFDWWGLSFPTNFSFDIVLRGSFVQGDLVLGAKIWQAVEWVCGYLIWKNRNLKVFKKKCWTTPNAINEIHVLSFDWIAKRCKSKDIDWHSWLHNPSRFLL